MLEGRIAGMVIETSLEALRGERVVAAGAGQPAQVQAGLRQRRVGLHRFAVRRDSLFVEPAPLLHAAEVVPGPGVRRVERDRLLEAAGGFQDVASKLFAHVAQPEPGVRLARIERQAFLERDAGLAPGRRIVVRVTFGQPVGCAAHVLFHGSAILAPPAVRRQSPSLKADGTFLRHRTARP